ncbi:MAG: PQQ-binding-like beta-propeller repeat protein [Methyloglobulus sp.]
MGTNTGIKSWQNNRWQIGGGTTWGWYSYDPKLNLIYYGSGNPVSFNPMTRPGDNKWTNALWARDADTGVVKWVYQMTPHDEWGFDGVNESVLIDQDIQGKPRKTLVHFDHNGFTYVLDRETGELLKADKFDQSVNWASHIDLKTGRPQVDLKYSTAHHGEEVNTHGICPSLVGAKGQQPVTYSPQTRLFYVSGVHLCQDLEPYATEKHITGQPYIDTTISLRPNSKDAMTGLIDEDTISEANDYLGNLGQLTAFDAKTGKIAWSNKERFMVGSGALSTAGGLVFYGTSEGYFKVLDAKSGKELYQFKTPSGIVGNINTWSFNGKQYLGVLSGIGGWAATAIPSPLEEKDKKFEKDLRMKIDAEKDPAKKAEREEKFQSWLRECSANRGEYHSPLGKTTKVGGTFTVFALPD